MMLIIYTDGGERTVPGENETEQPDHSTSLGDSITSSTRIRFSVHTRGTPRWPGGSCRLSLRRSAGCVDTGLDPASKEGNMKSRAGALRPSNSISRRSRERPDHARPAARQPIRWSYSCHRCAEADPLVSFWNECLTTLSHTVEKLLLFARRVTLGSSKIRFIVIIVRCRPVVDRRPRCLSWRL